LLVRFTCRKTFMLRNRNYYGAVTLLFNTRPKERRDDLYDRDKEIEVIKDSISRGEWIAVLGMRRIGKTSVVNVAVNESGGVKLRIDLFRLYNPAKKQYSKEEFLFLLIQSVNDTIKNYTFLGNVTRAISNILGVDEIEINKVKVKLRKIRGQDVIYILSQLNALAKDNKKKLVLVFDEAQELSKISGINFPSLFHDIYDNCTSTVLIFTGSMIRLVEKTLKDIEYNEPFFGRYIRKLELTRFTKEQSRDFLLKGFEEEKIKVDESIIEDAFKKFYGIPGWLTLFGSEYSFSAKHNLKVDIKEIVKKAIEEAKNEVMNFLKYSQSPLRYSAIILAIDRLGGKGKLNEIVKVSSTLLGEEIPRARAYEMLSRLIDLDFLKKDEEGIYSLHDDIPNRLGVVKAAEEVFRMR